jgi:hypothetical protein
MLQGDKSSAFTAMVAALDVLLAAAEPDGVHIIEVGLRGADNSIPVHPMQLHLLAEGKGTPLVHVVFANISPYKIYLERYIVECFAYPEGGCVIDTSVSEHAFTRGFLQTLFNGQIWHEKVDLCRESERLVAVKLADYKQPRGKSFEERYLDYSDYDVGPPLLSHILSSVGLKGHNPKYRLSDGDHQMVQGLHKTSVERISEHSQGSSRHSQEGAHGCNESVRTSLLHNSGNGSAGRW